jgi:hypothetical protein
MTIDDMRTVYDYLKEYDRSMTVGELIDSLKDEIEE